MMILGMAMALLLDGPAQAAQNSLIVPRQPAQAAAPRASLTPRASANCRATMMKAGQRVEIDLPSDEAAAGLRRLGRMPDANLIHAVLRTVGGQCELDVVATGVSTARRVQRPAEN